MTMAGIFNAIVDTIDPARSKETASTQATSSINGGQGSLGSAPGGGVGTPNVLKAVVDEIDPAKGSSTTPATSSNNGATGSGLGGSHSASGATSSGLTSSNNVVTAIADVIDPAKSTNTSSTPTSSLTGGLGSGVSRSTPATSGGLGSSPNVVTSIVDEIDPVKSTNTSSFGTSSSTGGSAPGTGEIRSHTGATSAGGLTTSSNVVSSIVDEIDPVKSTSSTTPPASSLTGGLGSRSGALESGSHAPSTGGLTSSSNVVTAIVDEIDPAKSRNSPSGLGGFNAASTGGMASSPNVPAPGSSINPETGLPHTAGLTRAELEARKASTAGEAQSGGLLSSLSNLMGGLSTSSNVPAPGSTINPDTGLPHTAGLTRAELDARKASAVGGAQTSGLMGGMFSPSNVPTPGSSINPETSLPHTAGVTRAELDAIKLKGQGLLDNDNAPPGAYPETPLVDDMSGREQAAAQLVGGGLPTTTSRAASPTVATGSIIDDIEKTASRLGQRAYEAVPSSVKDIFAEPKGKGVEGTPVRARRGSAAAIFENVRNQASKITTDIAHTVQNAVIYDPEAASTTATPGPFTARAPPAGLRDGSIPPISNNLSVRDEPSLNKRSSIIDTVTQQAKKISADVQQAMESGRYDITGAGTKSPATATTTNTEGAGGVLAQVKGFISDAFQNPPDSPANTYAAGPAQRYAFGTVPTSVPRSTGSAVSSPAKPSSATIPSHENQGSRPGEVTTGSGGNISMSTPAHLTPARSDSTPREVGSNTTPGEVKIGDDLYGKDVYGSGGENALSSSAHHNSSSTERSLDNTKEVKVGDDLYGKQVYSGDSTFGDRNPRPVPALGSGGNTSLSTPSHLNPASEKSVSGAAVGGVDSTPAHFGSSTDGSKAVPGGAKTGDDLGKGVSSDTSSIYSDDSRAGNDDTRISPAHLASSNDKGVYSPESLEPTSRSTPTNETYESTTTQPTTTSSIPRQSSNTTSSTPAHSFNTTSSDIPRSISSGSYGLAAALPSTFLGVGAAHGATSLKAIPGVDSTHVTETAPTPAASALQSTPEVTRGEHDGGLLSSTRGGDDHQHHDALAPTSGGVGSQHDDGLLAPTRGGVDRQHSLASVTAIRHGNEGDRNHESDISPLATIRSGGSDDATGTTSGAGVGSGVGELVGHDKSISGTSMTGSGTGSALGSNTTTSTSTSTLPKPEITKTGVPAPIVAPSSTTTTTPIKSPAPTTSTPTKSTLAVPTTPQSQASHGRTASSGSTGKKVGFMQKLKGEAKIISGKLKKDEEKIKLGERLKHGEA